MRKNFQLPYLWLMLLLCVCVKKKDNAGESSVQGNYRSKAPKLKTAYKLCFHTSARQIPQQLRSVIIKKFDEEFNLKTPIKIEFLQSECSKMDKDIVNVMMETAETKGTSCSIPQIQAHALIDVSTIDGTRMASNLYICSSSLNVFKPGVDTTKQDFAMADFAWIILHEFGHVVGLDHEHERLDVTKSDPTCLSRYKKHISNFEDMVAENRAPNDEGSQIAYGAYDPYSIMNYCAVGRGQTSTPDDVHLSTGDIALLNKLFQKNGDAQKSNEPQNAKSGESVVVGESEKGDVVKIPESELVFCQKDLLFKCIVTYQGGSGCLDTTRTNAECSPKRVRSNDISVILKDAKICMRSQGRVQDKLRCLPDLTRAKKF